MTQVNKKQIEALLAERDYSELGWVEELLRFSTIDDDVTGVLNLIPYTVAHFGSDQTKALKISIALYNLGYASFESLQETFADPQFHDDALEELKSALESANLAEFLQPIIAFAEGQV